MELQTKVLDLLKSKYSKNGWDSGWTDELVKALPEKDIELMNSNLWYDVASHCRGLTKIDFQIGCHDLGSEYRQGNNVNTTIVNTASVWSPDFFNIIIDDKSSIETPFGTFAVQSTNYQEVLDMFKKQLNEWPYDSRDRAM